MNRILVVDDEAPMLRIAKDLLAASGYAVKTAGDPLEVIDLMRSEPPDLALLDIRMPGKDGFQICREMKADPKLRNIPVVFLSVQADESDIVAGLELGAEDYIRKPYQKNELLARVRVVLRRRHSEPAPDRVTVGPITVDFTRFEATLKGAPLTLAPKELELLGFFLRREGHALMRTTISEEVWGFQLSPTSRTIDYHVEQLRKKLGPCGDWIKTLKGIGFRFEADE